MSTNVKTIDPRTRVRALSSGTAYFEDESRANSFRDWIFDRYHPAGYGTSCVLQHLDDGRFLCEWYVGSAD